jgi:MFS family permease
MPIARACDKARGALGDAGTRLGLGILALIALAEMLQMGIAPLLPDYAHRYGLSGLQTGSLIAATSLSTLAVSLPAGALADRLGARRLTLTAGWLIAGAMVLQALSPSYAVLAGSRLVFGVGFGIIWTAGLVWLTEATPPARRTQALAATVTSAGVGIVIGPALLGVVGERLGLETPFLVAGAAAVLLTAMLARAPSGPAVPADRPRLARTLRIAVREADIVGAVGAILVAGLASGIVTLLVPLELAANGLSAGGIGLAFSAAAATYILASTAVVKIGERAISLRALLGVAVALLIAFSPASASAASAAVIAVLILTALLRALLWTLGIPLGAGCAARRGIGEGAIMGVLNGVWAATTLIGPLVAGGLAGAMGPRLTYGTLQAVIGGILLVAWLGLRAAGTARPRSA